MPSLNIKFEFLNPVLLDYRNKYVTTITISIGINNGWDVDKYYILIQAAVSFIEKQEYPTKRYSSLNR